MIDDRPSSLPPHVAIRVAYLGVAAFIILGIIFFRLWYLQVLAGDHNVAQARANRVRAERIPAPRGEITDRRGSPIVSNRPATVVTLNPRSLPADYRDAILEWGRREGIRQLKIDNKAPGTSRRSARRPQPPPKMAELYQRLGGVLRMSAGTINRKVVESVVQVPYGNVRIDIDTDPDERDYIREHHEDFPDVDVRQRFLRKYPYKGLGAQVIGIIGEISPDQLGQRRFRDVPQGTVVGKEGLEYSYDRFLRGSDGEYSIVVDSNGDRQGVRTAREPRIGSTLQLTMDLGLQQTAQKALSIAGGGKPGAFVAMNPTNGDVYAMGSLPTYNPEIFSKSPTKAQLDAIFNDRGPKPAFNRAIGAGYPTASTFKPVTAFAAMDTKSIDAQTIIQDAGCIQIGAHKDQKKCNPGEEPMGALDLRRAITFSSNVFFTELAIRLDRLKEQPLQRWARQLGYGKLTGIDLPGSAKGLVPDRAWRDDANKRETECRRREHKKACGIADGENRPWQTGDEANLALGQGDLLASPLQVAVAYSTIANKGTAVRPHLGAEIKDDEGRRIQKIDPGARRHFPLDEGARNAIMDGLHQATIQGTSGDVFSGWPQERIPLYGKTGTAQRIGQPDDQAWYAVYGVDRSKQSEPIVIVTTVERGGFGAQTAAPAACKMLAKWFHVEAKCEPGKSQSL